MEDEEDVKEEDEKLAEGHRPRDSLIHPDGDKHCLSLHECYHTITNRYLKQVLFEPSQGPGQQACTQLDRWSEQ